jgi:hypothetical protein
MIEQLQHARALIGDLRAGLVLVRDSRPELAEHAAGLIATLDRLSAEVLAALAGIAVTRSLAEQLGRHLDLSGALARMVGERCAAQPAAAPPAEPDGSATHVG